MHDIAIQVKGLSKQYQIGAIQQRHNTLRDHIVHGVKGLFQRNGQRRRDDNTIWALKDVSLEVKRGEVVGLIGRNGAGKSTLLKILSRITDPTAGYAKITGRVASLLEVGTGFHSELTGRENTYMSGALLGMTKREIDRKFDDIVAFAEIDKFIDTPVKRYSSGMYVRLAFSVAAHLDTEILLVDEVLAVGDAAFQKKCLGQMEVAASRQGRTVLFVSHNMAAIENLCQRVILVESGQVVDSGPPNLVISSYLAGLSKSAETPLADRTDRVGAGQIRIVSLEVLDTRGEPLPYPVSGQGVVFRLHYHCRPGKVFRNCLVSLSISKEERAFVLLATDLVDKRQLDLQGSGHIDLIVPELPLSASNYTIDTFVQENTEIQDWVHIAAVLPVVDGDFYGTGKNYHQGWQGKVVLVKHSWRLGNQAET
jgi:lipopolysaccharide transport system ATP-binding protein